MGVPLYQLIVEVSKRDQKAPSEELIRQIAADQAYLRMIGEAQIVIQTPIEHHLPAETHVRPQLSFELRKSEITVCNPHVLTDRAARIFFETGKNIHHILFEF